MFAYVRYITYKEIVPTTYRCKDTSKIYLVRWQEDFFKGQILLLKGKLQYLEVSQLYLLLSIWNTLRYTLTKIFVRSSQAISLL